MSSSEEEPLINRIRRVRTSGVAVGTQAEKEEQQKEGEEKVEGQRTKNGKQKRSTEYSSNTVDRLSHAASRTTPTKPRSQQAVKRSVLDDWIRQAVFPGHANTDHQQRETEENERRKESMRKKEVEKPDTSSERARLPALAPQPQEFQATETGVQEEVEYQPSARVMQAVNRRKQQVAALVGPWGEQPVALGAGRKATIRDGGSFSGTPMPSPTTSKHRSGQYGQRAPLWKKQDRQTPDPQKVAKRPSISPLTPLEKTRPSIDFRVHADPHSANETRRDTARPAPRLEPEPRKEHQREPYQVREPEPEPEPEHEKEPEPVTESQQESEVPSDPEDKKGQVSWRQLQVPATISHPHSSDILNMPSPPAELYSMALSGVMDPSFKDNTENILRSFHEVEKGHIKTSPPLDDKYCVPPATWQGFLEFPPRRALRLPNDRYGNARWMDAEMWQTFTDVQKNMPLHASTRDPKAMNAALFREYQDQASREAGM